MESGSTPLFLFHLEMDLVVSLKISDVDKSIASKTKQIMKLTDREKGKIIETFKAMLANQHLFKSGMCTWFYMLWSENIISSSSYELTLYYIHAHKPFIARLLDTSYYWREGNIAPRIRYINRHIKKLSKQPHINHEQSIPV